MEILKNLVVISQAESKSGKSTRLMVKQTTTLFGKEVKMGELYNIVIDKTEEDHTGETVPGQWRVVKEQPIVDEESGEVVMTFKYLGPA